jgi:hypothetical protein
VVPAGKVEPEAKLLVSERMEQLSEADGAVQVTTDTHVSMSAGQFVMIGSSSSVTVTTWEHVAELPFQSVTVQTTVVFPTGIIGGALLVTVFTLQLSLVAGIESTVLETPQTPDAFVIVVSIGQVITGSMLSKTVFTVFEVEKHPLGSV